MVGITFDPFFQVRLMVGMAPVAAVPHMYSPLRYLTPVAREVRITVIITMLIVIVTIVVIIIMRIITSGEHL